MFRLSLTIQGDDYDSQISVSGQTLVVDGQVIDFSVLADGEECETALPLVGIARRINGVIEVGVRLKYSTTTAEPMQSTRASDFVVEVTSGEIPDVIRRKPKVEESMDAED